MQLLLVVALAFVVVGVTPRRFGGPQQAVVAVLAVTLAVLQFSFSRFL